MCFVLAFFGFGAKAGIIPLHGWLPKAHPEAPSNVSALMSGGMIKIGIFGILKVGLDLLSASGVQVWWGLMVMVFGAISSVLGVAFALLLNKIKRGSNVIRTVFLMPMVATPVAVGILWS